MGAHSSSSEVDVYKALSGESPNMIFINDFEKVVYANKKCTEVLGYTNEEFLSPSFHFLDLISNESHPSLKEAFSKHQKGVDVDPYEYILVSKSGERIHVVILTKLITWNGKSAILGTVTDISSHKLLEEQLRTSEEQYKLLLDSSNDAVFGIKDTRFVYVNERAVDMLGYKDKEELLAVSIVEIVVPEQRELVLKRSIARLSGEDPLNRYEVTLLRKDGTRIFVEFNISIVEFEGSRMNLTFARDTSEAVKHRNRLTALLGHAVLLASSETMDEIKNYTLDAMEDALEFQYCSYLEVINDALVIHSRFQDSEGMVLPLNGKGLTVKAANTKRSVLVNDTRLDSLYQEGTILSLSELDVPIIIGDKVVGVLNVEGKMPNMFTENEVQSLKLLAIHVSTAIDRLNKLQEVESLRDAQFKALIEGFKKTSASVRHDLRSPLMTIMNAINILKVQPNNEQMYDILMKKVKFIDTVLDDWRHQSYSGEINRINVKIKSMLSNVLENAMIPDPIEVIIDVENDFEFMLDKIGMLRVVSNLIKNSVDSIDGAGRITLHASLDETGLSLNVTDDGEGIKQEHLGEVFTPFFTTKETGTGIGLSYVKETVEAHGGNVYLSSLDGEGTTVSIHIPYSS